MCAILSHMHSPSVYRCSDTSCVCMMYASPSSRPSVAFDNNHCRVTTPTEDIKFGDASPVIRANRDKIVFDEFEYDSTSLRRTISLPVHHVWLPYVHPPHV